MKVGYVAVSALLVLQAACAPIPSKPNIADRDPLRKAVVQDVATALVEAFTPASTPLVPTTPANGAFDNSLRAALRGKGFVVAAVGGRGEPLDCRVDLIEGSMYRVTARVGDTLLSRLWVFDGSQAYPGGAWTRRE